MQSGEPELHIGWHRFGDFSAAQLYELLRFRQAIFVVEQASPYPDLDGRDQDADHLLLYADGELSGCLRMIPYPDDKRVAVGRVAVAPTRRGHGLARRMMEEALARVHRHYAGWAVSLGAQSYLVPFYETLGFGAASSPYDDYGVPHVDMTLARR